MMRPGRIDCQFRLARNVEMCQAHNFTNIYRASSPLAGTNRYAASSFLGKLWRILAFAKATHHNGCPRSSRSWKIYGRDQWFWVRRVPLRARPWTPPAPKSIGRLWHDQGGFLWSQGEHPPSHRDERGGQKPNHDEQGVAFVWGFCRPDVDQSNGKPKGEKQLVKSLPVFHWKKKKTKK